jgi:hypothetical protein
MSAPAVGIDLGTTNSVVAVSIGGRPQVLIDSNTGSTLIPSVVSFPEGGERVVGKAARLCRAQDPKNTVYSVKRLLGRPFKSEEVRRARSRVAFDLKEGPDSSVLVGTRAGEMSLPELSAYVLREVRRVAEAALRDKVEKCVVTVPANFNELQRSSTKVAGRIAELEVVRILNEPTAAALAYGYGRGTREKICIFDFGGGTFDVTLLELSGNVFEVLATAGDTFLGGDDIDIAITDSLVVPFQRATKIDPLQDRVVYDVLRDAAETAKCQLSTQDNTRVSLDYNPASGAPLRFQQQLSRADLERLAAPFISRTFDVCSDALKLAGLRPTDLTSVILVGGSTRIPSVRQRVASFFSRDPLTNLPPEEVVAMGASILAEALTGGTRRAPSTKSMNERASTIPPQQAPLPPSHSRPPSAGVPGVAGAPPRQTLSGVNPDSSTPGLRVDSVSGAKLVGEETMITDSPLVPPPTPSEHTTKRFGPVDLDDPFASPGAAPKTPPSLGENRAVGRTLELDEPSFMGRIRKQGVADDATREHSVPAFNLDDPSVVAPMPTSVRPRDPAKSPTLTEESYAKLPPSIAAAITPPPPRRTEHSVPSFQLDEAVLIGGDSASSPGARVREVSVPSFKIDTDDIFGASGAEATMIGEAPVIPGFDGAEAATFRPNVREPSMPGARLPEEPTRILPPVAAPKDDPTTVFPSAPPLVMPPAPTMNAQGVVVPPPLSSGARAPFSSCPGADRGARDAAVGVPPVLHGGGSRGAGGGRGLDPHRRAAPGPRVGVPAVVADGEPAQRVEVPAERAPAPRRHAVQPRGRDRGRSVRAGHSPQRHHPRGADPDLRDHQRRAGRRGDSHLAGGVAALRRQPEPRRARALRAARGGSWRGAGRRDLRARGRRHLARSRARQRVRARDPDPRHPAHVALRERAGRGRGAGAGRLGGGPDADVSSVCAVL